jgi:hypothetical protein
MMQQGTETVCSVKIASLHVPSIFSSCIFCLVRRDPQLILCSSMMCHRVDFYIPEGRFYLADAGFRSLNALVVPYRSMQYHLSEWDHAKELYINLLFSSNFSLMLFQVHTTPRSCSIYVMHQLAMLLSGSLGSSSNDFEFSSFHWSMT